MKDRSIDPHRIDMRSFARDAGDVSGQWPQASLPRLAAACEPALADAAPPPVQWGAQGELRQVAGAAAQVWLHLQADTSVRLMCQRCLLPLQQALQAERSFLFAHDEAEAARLDEEIEDDVLVFSRSLDLAELVEDELILALPLVPRHEQCPQPLLVPVDGLQVTQDQPHPFAALQALRRPRSEGS